MLTVAMVWPEDPQLWRDVNDIIQCHDQPRPRAAQTAPTHRYQRNCVHSTPATQLSARPPHYVQAEAEWHVSNASRAIISMVFGIPQLKLLGYSHFSLHSYNRSTSQMMRLTWKIHWISQTHRQQFWEFQRGMLFWRIDEDDQVIFHRFYQTELSASFKKWF